MNALGLSLSPSSTKGFLGAFLDVAGGRGFKSLASAFCNPFASCVNLLLERAVQLKSAFNTLLNRVVSFLILWSFRDNKIWTVTVKVVVLADAFRLAVHILALKSC